ncbi:MAG: carboxymuconolactone decarboxylase family protein [Planctomycetaceae bacterium]|nr:carboxymuconolactone decarboxylase family protein [Planctomycetaceae bacterium]
MSNRIVYKRVAPEAVKALGATKFYLDTTEITPRLRALLELRTSQINGCAYCVDLHSREARAAGEGQQRLDCLPVWRETELYDERERAALAWAESVTLVSETGVPDDVFEELQRRFSEKEIVDLTFIVASMNAWNRIAISFRQGPAKRAVGSEV